MTLGREISPSKIYEIGDSSSSVPTNSRQRLVSIRLVRVSDISQILSGSSRQCKVAFLLRRVSDTNNLRYLDSGFVEEDIDGCASDLDLQVVGEDHDPLVRLVRSHDSGIWSRQEWRGS
jgi:hypothetical protein